MKTLPLTRHRAAGAGFTLVEIMIGMSLAVMTLSLTLGTFMFCLRSMYKDAQRMATNSALRYFTAHVAKETIDSSEFHIFPSYLKLDGALVLSTDVSPQVEADYGTEVSYGDCLVLVTRTTIDTDSNIRQFRIYYRVVPNTNTEGSIRYYESPYYTSPDFPNGNPATITTLLNAVNLATTPSFPNSRRLVQFARGRPIPAGTHLCPLTTPVPFASNCSNHTTDCYPIFSSETSTATPVNEGVSINVEIITGTTAAYQLSSSSFNYTISPRR